ncbi:MAG TPA: DUF892 family protein [Conexibacter sp.]|jgi:ferritin-like metal-binding protein YciE|nr:DUF892 family protein [Conexibacter sp.]
MTPAGAYRSELDRHLRETRGHAEGIARRLRELDEGPGIAGAGIGIAQTLMGQLLSIGKTPLDMLRGGSPEEKLLKNAKDECATEALEIATYDALEQMARQAGDTATAQLAADHRADEERMLAALRDQLPQLTAAVVGAEVRGKPTYDAGSTGAAQTLRKTRRAAGDLAQDALHEARNATGTLSETQQREERRSPLPRYDELNVDDITDRLAELTPAQLRHVATYERAHKRRRGVLDAVEHRRAALN